VISWGVWGGGSTFVRFCVWGGLFSVFCFGAEFSFFGEGV